MSILLEQFRGHVSLDKKINLFKPLYKYHKGISVLEPFMSYIFASISLLIKCLRVQRLRVKNDQIHTRKYILLDHKYTLYCYRLLTKSKQ